MMREGAPQIPQIAEQLGVDIVTLRVFGPDHVVLGSRLRDPEVHVPAALVADDADCRVDERDLRPERTLQKLYLDPLARRPGNVWIICGVIACLPEISGIAATRAASACT